MGKRSSFEYAQDTEDQELIFFFLENIFPSQWMDVFEYLSNLKYFEDTIFLL